MQLRDLHRQYQILKPRIDESISSVVESSAFIMGKPVSELEQQLSQYVGSKYCIACANGTDALQLALMTWNIGPGDAVFVPDFTFFSSAEVVSLQGATPIFVDVDKDTYNIDVVDLEKKIETVISQNQLHPKVIVSVDLFGLPANYPQLKELASKYNLLLLEDGAQGFGGSIGPQRACSFGDIATTSFFPAKPLGCYGDGGAIFTNNEEWATILRSYTQHGKGSEKYDNVRIGLNSRLDTIQAAVLQVKLSEFPQEVELVNRAAEIYTERLKNVVKCPVIPQNYRSSWAQYTIQLDSAEQRNALKTKLSELSIPTAIYYPKPLHLQTAFSCQETQQCPNACQLANTVLSLPMHPYISQDEITKVVDSIIANTK